jgi:hypothetical protein
VNIAPLDNYKVVFVYLEFLAVNRLLGASLYYEKNFKAVMPVGSHCEMPGKVVLKQNFNCYRTLKIQYVFAKRFYLVVDQNFLVMLAHYLYPSQNIYGAKNTNIF